MHSHIYKYTLVAHTHDYAHVHAIVKMQFEIVLTRAQPNAHMNNYMHHTDMHVRKHIYANICVCSRSLSHVHDALSSHVTVKDLSSSYN